MEEHKPKFVSRSVALSGASKSYGTRSPWHGMDLHTTAPSTNRRAMYTPPPPSSPAATPAVASSQPATNNANNKIQTNDAALSARNLVIRRKLSERKRFDSADYAMKTVMSAMHAPGAGEEGEEGTAAVPPPPAVSPPQMPSTPLAMNSPRLSPSHARMGVSVFKDALKVGQRGGEEEEDEPMLEQPLSPQPGPARQRPVEGQQPQQPQSAASRYGGIGRAGMSPAGAMSARNIMIQKKMHEKRHFDSADWQLAQYGVQTDAAMDKPVEASPPPVERTPSPMQLSAEAMASPASSPSAVRAAVMRNAHLYAQMSPSVRSSTDEMHRQAAARESAPDASKYAGLSGSNELLQRRLAEKKRFDSADYNMVAAARAAPSTDGQLRRAALLRQQQQNYSARQQAMAAPQANFLGAPSTGIAPPPAPMQDQTPLAVAADAAAGTSKYGKLCAANVLLRKKLKERKRFDSADYQMARAKHQDPSTSMGSESMDNNDAGSSSPVMNPQAKHIKLSEGAAPSRWASHAAVVAMRPSGTSTSLSPSGVTREAGAAAPVSLEGRLAARSVLIHRHLAERKRFDSADHFAAKAEAIRARRDASS